jgi:hypothetical protein
MKPELVKQGLLTELSTLKFGKLTSKDGKKYRAFQHTNGDPIFLGSSLKDKSDDEVKKLSDSIIVGKVTSVEDGVKKSNFVAMLDSWTWE